jgi:hypothetical protein
MMLKGILTIDGDAFCNKEWASPKVAVEEVAFFISGRGKVDTDGGREKVCFR